MSLLTGQAAAWSLAISGQPSDLLADYQTSSEEMKWIFDHPVKSRQAVGQLLDLQQGSQPVSQYAISFRILAAESGWGDAALRAVFSKGLSEEIKDELAIRDESTTLNDLIDLAIRLDNRLRERKRERQESRQRPQSSSHLPPAVDSTSPALNTAHNDPEPRQSPAKEVMQLGRARLSPAERQRRMKAKLCLYCGHEGHFISHCPELPKGQARQGTGGPWWAESLLPPPHDFKSQVRSTPPSTRSQLKF